MLENFIYDLTGKKMPEPDDVMDNQQGQWKSRIFGEPFDYGTKKTRNQILKYYLNERPLELIIVEGENRRLHFHRLLIDDFAGLAFYQDVDADSSESCYVLLLLRARRLPRSHFLGFSQVR
jgi:hypothetical protein